MTTNLRRTRVSSTQVDSEEHVKEVAKERVEKTKGLVVVNFPMRDTDRMQSFCQSHNKPTGHGSSTSSRCICSSYSRSRPLERQESTKMTSECTFLEKRGAFTKTTGSRRRFSCRTMTIASASSSIMLMPSQQVISERIRMNTSFAVTSSS